MRWLLLCAALFAAFGCRSGTSRQEPEPLRVEAGVPRVYWPAFEALADAVERHEDELARHLLESLRGRLDLERAEPGTRQAEGLVRAREMAAAYDRILRGRELLRKVRFELYTVDVASSSAVRLFLRVHSLAAVEATLRPGPASLLIEQTSLSPKGGALQSAWQTHLPSLHELQLAPEVSVELPLGSYPAAVARDSLALRLDFRLELRSGELVVGGESLPAAGIPVASHRLERLSPQLPTDSVEPTELERYARRGLPWTPALLERTVRIPVGRREEALDLLEPLVLTSTEAELERLAPALRWLTVSQGPSGGPLGWKGYFEQRAAARARPPLELPTLVLPGS